MTKTIAVLAALLSLESPAFAQAGAIHDVYVFAGQSNAVGTAKCEPTQQGATIAGAKIWLNSGATMDAMRWCQNTVQAPQALPNNKFGTEVSFAQAYHARFPGSQMLALKYAKGSTSLLNDQHWNPAMQTTPGNLYAGLKARMEGVKAAVGGGKLRCFVWVQGEQDRCGNCTEADRASKHAQYKQLSVTLFGDVRATLHSPNARVVMVRLTPPTRPGEVTAWAPATTAFRAVQQQLAAENAGVRLVNADDVPKWPFQHGTGDPGLHYNTAGIMTLGTRIFEACHRGRPGTLPGKASVRAP